MGKGYDRQPHACEYTPKEILSQFSCSVASDSLWPHGLQHTRLPCPWPTPDVYSNSCPSSRWCHQTMSSSVIPSCLQFFPASGSFPMSQFFAWGGQSIGATTTASVLPMNMQDWFPLGLMYHTPVIPSPPACPSTLEEITVASRAADNVSGLHSGATAIVLSNHWSLTTEVMLGQGFSRLIRD